MSLSKVKTFDVLTDDDVKRIHETSMKVLESVGMVIEYEPALEILREAGQKVEGNRVYFDPAFVEEKIALAPSEFKVYGRVPEHDITIGIGHVVHTPCYGSTFIMEPGGKRRPAVWNDYMNFLKLSHVSEELDTTGGMLVEPSDLEDKTRYLDTTYSHIRYSTKTFMGATAGAQGVRDTLELLAPVHGGKEAMKKKPANVTLVNTITPLKLDERMAGVLVEGGKWRVPILVAAALMCGSTGPATLAGGLVVQNAEVLGAIALLQTISPGNPVIYGSASAISDMNSGVIAIGSAESAMLTAASAQLARFYKMPCRGGGVLNDAKVVDAQAGYESALMIMNSVLSGVNYQYHSAGMLHSWLCMSYEKFVMDLDIVGMLRRYRRGIDVNDETLAFDVIKAVGPGGHYLTQKHTKRNHRKEFRRPILSDRSTYDSWINANISTEQRATQIYQKMLAKYEDPGIDPAVDKEMKDYMERRKKEILG